MITWSSSILTRSQWTSSELSSQSLKMLQRFSSGIQRPSLQVNSPSEHWNKRQSVLYLSLHNYFYVLMFFPENIIHFGLNEKADSYFAVFFWPLRKCIEMFILSIFSTKSEDLFITIMITLTFLLILRKELLRTICKK